MTFSHLVSTFSPIKSADLIVEGILRHDVKMYFLLLDLVLSLAVELLIS